MSGTKQISIEQLIPGMFVVEMDLPWYRTPFLFHKRLSRDMETIGVMKQHGVRQVTIDPSKGLDGQALADALKSGKLAAAGIDVYQEEPPTHSPLIGLPNVIHTPHLGASTQEAQKNVGIEMVEQIADALRGEAFRNVLNAIGG